MSSRKGNHKKQGPQSEQETDTAKLIAEVVGILEEKPSDFLPGNQVKEFFNKNFEKAERKAERVLELEPSQSRAHHLLGVIRLKLAKRNAQMLAAQSFILAAEHSAGTETDAGSWTAPWAASAVEAHHLLILCPGIPRPAWWTDEGLLRASERAVQLLPESEGAQRWRAEVLSGYAFITPPTCTAGSSSGNPPPLVEPMAPRTPTQLRAAAAHYAKAGARLSGEEETKTVMAASVACVRAASQAEKAEKAGVQDSGAGEANSTSADDPAFDSSGVGGKNAAKNKKKKERQKAKAAEGAAAEGAAAEGAAAGVAAVDNADSIEARAAGAAVDAVGEVGEVRKEASANDQAVLAAAAAVAAAAKTPLELAPVGGYRWANPLPPGYQAVLKEMGIEAGMPVTEADLKGIAAEGGPQVAVAVGLVEPF